MKASYIPEDDILRILWTDVLIDESDEVEPGVILDYDQDSNVVGIEILNASKHVENLASVHRPIKYTKAFSNQQNRRG